MDPAQLPAEARLHFLDYWRVIRTRKAIVFIVFLLVVLVATTVTYFQPKIYVSAVTMKVEQERPSVAVFEAQYVPSYDPFFLQTQYQIIQSQKVLYPVIEKMHLQELWSRGGATLSMDAIFQRLKSKIGVRRYPDTSLIEIMVQDEDRIQAAAIANTIAEVFETERLEVKRDQTTKGIDKLREELQRQQDKLSLAQKRVEDLRKELGIPVFGSAMLIDQRIQRLDTDLAGARMDAVTKETKFNGLQKLTPQELRNTIATSIIDPSVQNLLQNLTDTEQRITALKEDYGPDNPTIRQVMASRDKIEQQLTDRLDGVMKGYKVELDTAEARVAALQKDLEDLKTESLELQSDKYLKFHDAERGVES
jgi:uncharacterized protein involved in exopolysaccharide biosynthesis